MGNHGVSQEELVNNENKARKLPQYIAALAATLGAFATGTVLGWSSPVLPRLGEEYKIKIASSELPWIGSIASLGATFICFPIGIIMDKFGRKHSMLGLTVPFTIGWILLITANNIPMLLAGRFILGLAGGAVCVTAPAYTSEIAQDEIRGTLGSFYQLMLTVGILFSYAVGSYVDIFIFNIICTVIPIIFFAVFFFMPQTPYFLLTKNKKEEAEKSLKWLRGPDYNIENEMRILNDKIAESSNSPLSLKQSFSRSSIKVSIICYTIMFFQQFTGINVVLFYSEDIFKESGAPDKISTIVLGVIAIVATLCSTVVVDRLGRKILLMISGFMMSICGVLLAVYFYYKDTLKVDMENNSWMPLVLLSIFITAFSLGFGPIPWMLASDLCSPEIKTFISSTAGTFNWLFAFIIMSTFNTEKLRMGNFEDFLFFGIITFASIPFVQFLIPETKGKSNEEIQQILKGDWFIGFSEPLVEPAVEIQDKY